MRARPPSKRAARGRPDSRKQPPRSPSPRVALPGKRAPRKNPARARGAQPAEEQSKTAMPGGADERPKTPSRHPRRLHLRRFVGKFLEATGGAIAREEGEILHVRMPETLEEGGRDLALAFGTQVQRSHPEAEVVAIGSAFLDRVLGEAVSLGRHSVSYLPAPRNAVAPRGCASLPAIVGHHWDAPQRGARPVFLFVYLAEYHTIDVRDDLVLIALDPQRRSLRASSHAWWKAFARGSAQPEPGWPPASSLPTAGDLVRSFALLDGRLERRAHLVREASALEIERETANIEAYYRQLIDEARHPVGRTRQTADEEAERVRQLQLDWKRRVQEVAGFWEAFGDVRLSAVAAVMEPCWIIPLRPDGARRARRRAIRPPYAVADWRGRLAEPLCALCGSSLNDGSVCAGQDLICGSHS